MAAANLAGPIGWSRDLSAATDARVARMAEGMRGRSGWATGRTPATDPRIARGVEKRVGVKRGMYRRHREPSACIWATGDGYLAEVPNSCRLETVLDVKYPDLVDTCAAAMKSLYPEHKVARRAMKATCVVVYSHGCRWLSLFPHHGPGRKHERRIELVDWQQDLVPSRRSNSFADSSTRTVVALFGAKMGARILLLVRQPIERHHWFLLLGL
jgi:hypothetical protein